MEVTLQTLQDKITKDFTVNKTRSNKIILFDLDDTIINTSAKILVIQDGVTCKSISNAEFNNYILNKDEKFCFDEFNHTNVLNKETFTSYWKTLIREYNKGTHIGILTARCDCSMIKNFFKNNGIDIKDELIIAINDSKLGLTGSIQDRKAEAISILSNAGYNTFIMFDDNEQNLNAAKQLEDKLNIIVKTIKV